MFQMIIFLYNDEVICLLSLEWERKADDYESDWYGSSKLAWNNSFDLFLIRLSGSDLFVLFNHTKIKLIFWMIFACRKNSNK